MSPRKKKGDDEAGAPAWIVTFSDLMSLLLTFFVLLLSFSTISENEFNEAMMSLQGAFGVLDRFTSVVATTPRPARQASHELARTARLLRRQLQVVGKEKQVKIEFDAQGGLKISLPDSILFGPGSAELQAEAFPILRDVGETLAQLPDAFIEVRGHTDASPVGAGAEFRDNYDLSYYRAYSVADRLTTESCVPRHQFLIVAAGPNQPIATNDTATGRIANRRVEIIVRGLVNRETVESLSDRYDDLDADPRSAPPAVSPREYEDLR